MNLLDKLALAIRPIPWLYIPLRAVYWGVLNTLGCVASVLTQMWNFLATRTSVAAWVERQVLGGLAAASARQLNLSWHPGWQFATTDRPDRWHRFRKAIWTRCRDRRCFAPLTLTWTRGIRFRSRLGNDTTRCLYVEGSYEPNELMAIASILRPGDTAVDVGANEGLFTVHMAGCVGASGIVLAIEPSSREFRILEANQRVNAFTQVRPKRIAVSDHTGTAELHIAGEGHSGQNTLGGFVYRGVDAVVVEQVELRTLDQLVQAEGLQRVHFMKLDCEGSECRVLKGSRDILTRHRPVIMMELCDPALRAMGSSANEVVGLLREHGYRIHVFDATDGRPRPATDGEPWSGNILAIHMQSAAPSFA